MATSRESYNIWKDIQSKNWSKVRSSINTLLVFWKKSWSRTYIIKDSIVTPFNKHIGCKAFGHKWSTEEDDGKFDLGDMVICWKCFKWETKQERVQNIREDKIDQLLK